MFLKIVVLVALALTCSNAENWKLPTAIDIQTTMDTCLGNQQEDLNVDDINAAAKEINIRCFAKELGLWSDEEGFLTQRFTKLFSKHQVPTEITVVINYCNRRQKQSDLDKWASEAYFCFARGRLGAWIAEYIQNVYKNKITV